jgi:hypothetical protein
VPSAQTLLCPPYLCALNPEAATQAPLLAQTSMVEQHVLIPHVHCAQHSPRLGHVAWVTEPQPTMSHPSCTGETLGEWTAGSWLNPSI